MFKLNWIIPPQFEPIQFTYERHYDVQLPQTVRFQPGAKLNAAFNRKIKLLFKGLKAETSRAESDAMVKMHYIYFCFVVYLVFKKQIHNKGHGSDSFVVPSDGESISIYFYGSQALRCQGGLWDCSALAVSCYGSQSFTFTFFVARCVTFISKTTKSNAIVKKKL